MFHGGRKVTLLGSESDWSRFKGAQILWTTFSANCFVIILISSLALSNEPFQPWKFLKESIKRNFFRFSFLNWKSNRTFQFVHFIWSTPLTQVLSNNFSVICNSSYLHPTMSLFNWLFDFIILRILRIFPIFFNINKFDLLSKRVVQLERGVSEFREPSCERVFFRGICICLSSIWQFNWNLSKGEKEREKKKKNHNFLHFPSAVSFPSTAEIMQFGKWYKRVSHLFLRFFFAFKEIKPRQRAEAGKVKLAAGFSRTHNKLLSTLVFDANFPNAISFDKRKLIRLNHFHYRRECSASALLLAPFLRAV